MGEPGAISSVRRPRKTVTEQRIKREWTRTRSLKENPRFQQRKYRGVPSLTVEISRSQSLKEGPNHRPRLRKISVESSCSTSSPLAISRSSSNSGLQEEEDDTDDNDALTTTQESPGTDSCNTCNNKSSPRSKNNEAGN